MAATRSYFDTSDPCWFRTVANHPLVKLTVAVVGSGPVFDTIRAELDRLGIQHGQQHDDADADIVLGTLSEVAQVMELAPESISRSEQLPQDGFVIDRGEQITVIANAAAGVLYGWFYLLRNQRLPNRGTTVVEAPHQRIRMLNHWDNADDDDAFGSVERGYAGSSIFFDDGTIVTDRRRVLDYCRLLASVGINAVSINNVNVHRTEARLLCEQLDDVAALADIMRGFAISLYVSVDFAGPVTVGGLPTADPLEPDVVRWWCRLAQSVYERIPDFGGYVVKADSEGRAGPFEYGRTHIDGANTIAASLAPFGGHVFWRCFVYNAYQDWRDRSTDRARAAYDHFAPLDGDFAENVVLQVKHGPMDFQVREPVSPLIGALDATNMAVELQLTQEYTGHQIDLFCLPTMWERVLSFDLRGGRGDRKTVADVLSGECSARLTGLVGVANIGSDWNWTGHPFAQVNLYGFGRQAWDPTITAAQIVDEWIDLTYSLPTQQRRALRNLLLESADVYESYTAPLGIGWMVTPGSHYGPSIDGYEYSRWGTYHFADRCGVGVDRTRATGTGYASQYLPGWAEQYESLQACPDELLLFFHHVPYTHVLQSGKSVIQHIYDTHFEGYERVLSLVETVESLQAHLDLASFTEVRERAHAQLANAREWRDQVVEYFYRKSGIPDDRGRTREGLYC